MQEIDWNALRAEFDDDQLSTARNRGGTFTYAKAQAVQNRLDDVCPGQWSSNVEVADPQNNAVKCTITIWPGGNSGPISRSDFGYPNANYTEDGSTVADDGEVKNDRHEPLKEAATDAFRRAASLFGVGRYLYKGGRGAGAPSAPRQSGGGSSSSGGRGNHEVGEVWRTPDGDLMIQCAQHGGSYAMEWGGKNGNPLMIKCKRKDQSGDWCNYMVPDQAPAATPAQHEAQQAANEPREITVSDFMQQLKGLREKNGWSNDDLEAFLGEPPTAGVIRRWVAEGGTMQGLSNKVVAYVNKKKVDAVAATQVELPDDLPFE